MKEINQKFIERMKSLLGDDVSQFLGSLSLPAEKGIVVNQNKVSVEDFQRLCDFKVSPVGYDPNGFYIDDLKLGHHPLHHAGAFYIQDPGAMFTVNAYNFNGDEKVLDMCASPGGKSIQIANRIPNGVLVSNEINRSRSQILFSNIERMGLENVIITNETPKRIGEAYQNTFDVCLVDAPCSAEGMIRKDTSILDNWNENLTYMCAKRQLEILDSADRVLKKGGILIYSTCTYSKIENEDVVRTFKEQYGYELIKIDMDLPRGIDMPEAVRLYPHKTKGEGQFVAVMQKISDNLSLEPPSLRLNRNEKVEKFINSLCNFDEKVYDFVDFSYSVKNPDMIRKNINYISIGVRLASNKSNIIKPEQYLFSAFGKSFKNKVDLDLTDINLIKYLKGDIFHTYLGDGYACVLVGGVPLGGLKVSNGEMKNLYPKGLRD